MLRPGLVSVTFRQYSPAEVVKLVRQAGLSGIEWGGDIHVPHGDIARAREVRDITAQAALSVAAYGSYYRVGHSEDAGLPFERVLASAYELGAPTIRVWAGATGSASMSHDERRKIVGDIQRIATLAQRVGVRIAAEFHDGTLNDMTASAVQLLQEVDHSNYYSYWQRLCGLDDAACTEGLTALGARLAHLHVYEWRAEKDRETLAAGAPHWSKFLRVAAAAPGDRYAMLEFVEGNAPENFTRDAATLKTLLAGGVENRP